jgi:glycosyltransferase involved in cell wall biosynthesis
MTVCALIPTFNEAPHIGPIVRRTRRHVQLVVVIDDGSDDGTADVAREAGAVCLRLAANRGKASALRAGIAFAAERDFSYVLMLDGDGQHVPDDIPALIRGALESKADLVLGARPFARGAMPRSRYYSNTIGSQVTSWLVGRKIADSQCGFRLVRLNKLRQLNLRATKYELEMEVLIKMVRAGCSTLQVPVQMVYHDGRARSKMKPVRDTVRICLWSLAFRFFKM